MPAPYDALRAVLSDRPIAFHPMLARVLGGINEALLFQQLAYWSDKGQDPEWIYKTQKELEAETTLTRTQQENARKTLRRLGVVQEQKRGLPAKLYYRVDWPSVFALLEAATKDAGNPQPRMRELGSQGSDEPANQPAAFPQPLTESTAESTGKDSFETSKSLNDVDKYDEPREIIGRYVEDFAREFSDRAPLTSSITRAQNLYRQSGLRLEAFVEVMYQARQVTKERSASVKTEPDATGRKQRMQYWFAILEDRLRERP